MDNQSIQHTRWNCICYIVFIPKYRRKIMYGEIKKDQVELLKKLCGMKQVQLIDGKVCADHVYMYCQYRPRCVFRNSCRILKERVPLCFSTGIRRVGRSGATGTYGRGVLCSDSRECE